MSLASEKSWVAQTGAEKAASLKDKAAVGKKPSGDELLTPYPVIAGVK